MLKNSKVSIFIPLNSLAAFYWQVAIGSADIPAILAANYGVEI